jgi:hypothetical protein
LRNLDGQAASGADSRILGKVYFQIFIFSIFFVDTERFRAQTWLDKPMSATTNPVLLAIHSRRLGGALDNCSRLAREACNTSPFAALAGKNAAGASSVAAALTAVTQSILPATDSASATDTDALKRKVLYILICICTFGIMHIITCHRINVLMDIISGKNAETNTTDAIKSLVGEDATAATTLEAAITDVKTSLIIARNAGEFSVLASKLFKFESVGDKKQITLTEANAGQSGPKSPIVFSSPSEYCLFLLANNAIAGGAKLEDGDDVIAKFASATVNGYTIEGKLELAEGVEKDSEDMKKFKKASISFQEVCCAAAELVNVESASAEERKKAITALGNRQDFQQQRAKLVGDTNTNGSTAFVLFEAQKKDESGTLAKKLSDALAAAEASGEALHEVFKKGNSAHTLARDDAVKVVATVLDEAAAALKTHVDAGKPAAKFTLPQVDKSALTAQWLADKIGDGLQASDGKTLGAIKLDDTLEPIITATQTAYVTAVKNSDDAKTLDAAVVAKVAEGKAGATTNLKAKIKAFAELDISTKPTAPTTQEAASGNQK